MPDSETDRVVAAINALADRTRLRILTILSIGEASVNEMESILGESQPKISRHLAYLRRAGLVTTRRDGRWVYYSLSHNDGRLEAKILDSVLSCFNSDAVDVHRSANLVSPARSATKAKRSPTQRPTRPVGKLNIKEVVDELSDPAQFTYAQVEPEWTQPPGTVEQVQAVFHNDLDDYLL